MFLKPFFVAIILVCNECILTTLCQENHAHVTNVTVVKVYERSFLVTFMDTSGASHYKIRTSLGDQVVDVTETSYMNATITVPDAVNDNYMVAVAIDDLLISSDFSTAVSSKLWDFTDVRKTGFKVSWKPYRNAQDYFVYLYIEASIYSSDVIGSTSHDFDGLQPSTVYNVLVKADEQNSRNQGRLTDLFFIPQITSPSTLYLRTTKRVATNFTISWDPIWGALYYETFLSERLERKNTTETHLLLRNLVVGEFYLFEACSVTKSERICGSLNITVEHSIYVINITVFDVRERMFRITFLDISEGNHYRVRTSLGNKVVDITETSYTNATITVPNVANNNYMVAVAIDDPSILGNFSAGVSIKIWNFSDVRSTGFKVSWKPFENTQRYIVYLYNSDTTSIYKTYEVRNASQSVDGLQPNTVYNILVTADQQISWNQARFKDLFFIPQKTLSSILQLKIENQIENNVTISWVAVKGTIYYETFLSKTLQNAKTIYTNVSLTGLIEGRTYLFEACSVTKSETICGAINITLAPSAPSLSIVENTGSSVKVSWNTVVGTLYYSIIWQYRKIGSSVFTGGIGRTTTVPNATLSNLKYETEYSLQVCSVNLGGQSCSTIELIGGYICPGSTNQSGKNVRKPCTVPGIIEWPNLYDGLITYSNDQAVYWFVNFTGQIWKAGIRFTILKMSVERMKDSIKFYDNLLGDYFAVISGQLGSVYHNEVHVNGLASAIYNDSTRSYVFPGRTQCHVVFHSDSQNAFSGFQMKYESEKVCFPTTLHKNDMFFSFNETLPQLIAYSNERCDAGSPQASVICDFSGATGRYEFSIDQLEYSACDSSSIPEIISRVDMNNVSSTSLEKTLHHLDLKSSVVNSLNDTDVASLSTFVSELSKNKTAHKVSEQMYKRVLHIADHVAEFLQSSSTTTDSLQLANERLLPSLTSLGNEVPLSQPNASLTLLTSNIAAKVLDHKDITQSLRFQPEIYSSKHLGYMERPVVMDIPAEAFEKSRQSSETCQRTKTEMSNLNSGSSSIRVVLFLYRTSSIFPSNETADWVISASLCNRPVSELKNPVITTYNFINISGGQKSEADRFEDTYVNQTCTFWNTSIKRWSTNGCCRVKDSNPPQCKCNHLTEKALLQGIDKVLANTAVSTKAKIGSIIAIASLFFIIAILHAFVPSTEIPATHWLNFRIKVLKHICGNMNLVYLTFITGVDKRTHINGCITGAVFLHFLLLTCLLWIAVYAKLMHKLSIMETPELPRSYKRMSMIFVYGVSALVVGINVAITLLRSKIPDLPPLCDQAEGVAVSEMVDDRYCWLHGKSLYFSFLLPAGVIMLFILVTLSLVISRAMKVQSNSTDNFDTIHSMLRVVAAFILSLGLVWTSGYLMITCENISSFNTINWLYSIAAAMQGVFLFWLLCLYNAEIRECWWPFEPIVDYFSALRDYPRQLSERCGLQARSSGESQSHPQMVENIPFSRLPIDNLEDTDEESLIDSECEDGENIVGNEQPRLRVLENNI